MTKEDRKPSTNQKEGYFMGWRRKDPGYDKWGATLIDNKESHTGKRGTQQKEV
jgi:hypothetical protein